MSGRTHTSIHTQNRSSGSNSKATSVVVVKAVVTVVVVAVVTVSTAECQLVAIISLAGAATSIIFVKTKILSRQNTSFVATKHISIATKLWSPQT